jgi:hypothetical protein
MLLLYKEVMKVWRFEESKIGLPLAQKNHESLKIWRPVRLDPSFVQQVMKVWRFEGSKIRPSFWHKKSWKFEDFKTLGLHSSFIQ